MIVDIQELLTMREFQGYAEEPLRRKVKAVEHMIRAYTNNNFQNRRIRFATQSTESSLLATSAYIKSGNTIQISESINDGIYTVDSVGDAGIVLQEGIYPAPHNLVTRVDYPENVVDGVISLLKWEVANRSKVGIKSETLSRHSVTYYDQDANNQVMGYPVSLLGFLKPYMKARF